MKLRYWAFLSSSLLELLAEAHGQTTPAVKLTFADFSNRLQDTGSSDVTFSASNDSLTYSAGPGGTTAAHFDGNSYLTASSSPITNAFTIAFWLNTSTAGTGAGQTDWYKGSGLVDGDLLTATQDWGVSLLGDKVALGIGGPPDQTLISTSSVTTGTWVYVTATWDGSSDTATLYLNGQQNQSSAVSGDGRITADPFEIGKDPTAGGAYTGALADIQIYTTAFTAGEVESNYQLTAVPEPSASALVAGIGALGWAVLRRRLQPV